MSETPDATRLLIDYGNGRKESLDEMLPLVYAELHRLAEKYLSRERPDHTLQPTALVHEAYLRLIDQHSVDWQNRAQFIGLAAQMMRRILVNHAEAHRAARRGDGLQRITLDESIAFFEEQNLDLLSLHAALTELARFDEQKSRIVELRFFGGLTIEETARLLEKSTATVEREWTFAKAWLKRALT
ncbi:MAG: sigma-70 family RNA polymerase sigma factor [Acidobacteria bacterium]|nr:sigma-70 family RNA polymerase sigma factor [Acidobacteriota bacterium]